MSEASILPSGTDNDNDFVRDEYPQSTMLIVGEKAAHSAP